MKKKRINNYERYVRDRAMQCGYSNLSLLADALDMSLTTLMSRLRRQSDWSMAEGNKLEDVLNLNACQGICMSFYHTSPYDEGYASLVCALNECTLMEAVSVNSYDYYWYGPKLISITLKHYEYQVYF